MDLFRRDARVWQNGRILGDDNNAVLHHPGAGVHFGAAREGLDHHPLADAHIFIQDGTLDDAVGANAQVHIGAFDGRQVVIICSHDDAVLDLGAGADLAAQADDRVVDLRLADAAAFRQQDIVQVAVLDGRTGQGALVGVDGAFRVEEVEGGVGAGEGQVGFVERVKG